MLLTPLEGQPLALLLTNQGQNRKHRVELHPVAAMGSVCLDM